MKFQKHLIKSLLVPAAALCVLMTASCQKEREQFRFTAGEEVHFTIGSGGAATKAAYSGVKYSDDTIERIDWEVDDTLRIYCGAVSEPSTKWADYVVTDVTPDGASSTARINGTGGVGLRWGTGDHTFYAVYPSPEAGSVATAVSISPYSDGGTKGSVSKSISGATVTASLPAEQRVIGSITHSGSSWTAAPDLKNMLMTAKADPYTEAGGIPDGENVFLSFTPLTTAIKFTITNSTGSQLDLTAVQLISGNKKTSAEPVISGAFSVNMDMPGITTDSVVKPFSDSEFTVTYGMNYPKCTATAAKSANMADRTLTISVGTDTAPLSLAVGETFTFTFFLSPIHHFNDLTFKLVKAGGSWMSTRLGYTDGNGIFFPRHKKTTVAGLLVPEGAQWRVSFGPDVTPWDAEHGELDDIDLNYPEGETITLMTAWEEGESATIDMVRSVVTFVDLGLPSGTLWADRNVGAESETAYGDYFAWGEIAPRAADWATSKPYNWANAPFNNGAADYDATYFGANLSNWVDGTTLKPEYDAAYVAYGDGVSMPTRLQFKELMDNCTMTWTENYEGTGVNGIICTSNISGYTDKYIFLPAAGRRSETGNGKENVYLRYWSSTLSTETITSISSGDGSRAWGMFTDDNDANVMKMDGFGSRFQGRSVRAVRN